MAHLSIFNGMNVVDVHVHTFAGYDKLYNYAFLGPGGRIGTASDFVFAFVPHGPKKQLDLIFHAIGCHQQGLSRVCQPQ